MTGPDPPANLGIDLSGVEGGEARLAEVRARCGGVELLDSPADSTPTNPLDPARLAEIDLTWLKVRIPAYHQ